MTQGGNPVLDSILGQVTDEAGVHPPSRVPAHPVHSGSLPRARMKVLVAVGANASVDARRFAADQVHALRALGVDVTRVVLDRRRCAPSRVADVVHLHPGPETTPEQVADLRRRAPLLLVLSEPGRAGADLVPGADQVVVPSRHALVHLLDQVDLRPRLGRILFPGTPFTRRSEAPPLGAGPLRLVHLGSRRPASGLADLAAVLAELPEGAVTLDCVGPASGQDARLVALAGSAPVRFHPWPDPGTLPTPALEAHLAVFPWRSPERYALGVDDALALGVPVWVSGGEAVGERHDASTFTDLPLGDPDAWREELETWLADPTRADEAYEALPHRVPSTTDAVQALVRWSSELIHSPREFDNRPYRRLA